ncbi:hypothetical protein HOF92_15135 [bacterium]|jgi:hypothetical protein|nr:hypothetical protein [bacterium]
MNSRQVEDSFKQELEKIQQKVRLGEISQEEGEFLLMQIREKTRRKISRLKRPSRMIFYVLSLVFSALFIYCFFTLYSDLSLHDLGLNDLYILGLTLVAFIVLFFFELRRVEKTISKYFSRAFFHRVLNSPEIEFEVRKMGLIQVRIQIKNLNNLFAGLGEDEIWQLRSQTLSTITSCLDNGKAVFEEMGPNCFVVNYPLGDGLSIRESLKRVESVFSQFQMMQGQWFSKSIQVGASLVSGEFLCGNLGDEFQQNRTHGRLATVSSSLVEAAGWFEILMDEKTLDEIQAEVYFEDREPLFLRSVGELVPVFRFLNWKVV